jgi:hypothetical protein
MSRRSHGLAHATGMQPCRAWVLELEREDKRTREEHISSDLAFNLPRSRLSLEVDWRWVNKGALTQSSHCLARRR